MDSTVTYARPELLQVADTVARDKGIDKDEVLEAMEQAIQKAGRSKYGQEYDIRAEIDRRNGEIRLLRFREVVDAVENEATQMPLAAAQRLNAEAEIGDFITDPLPPIDFGRIAAQTAKQVIVQKVRDAERKRQYLEFKDRVGEIVNGLVKRVEFGNVVVDLGRAEAMLRRDELLPRESFRQGEVSKVVMDEEQRRIEVVVPDDQLSLAIGRRGQNVRLASQLTGWDIDILTEAEESERRTEEFRTRSQLFIDALDIDEVIAHLLVTAGFGALGEVASVPVEGRAATEGFDIDVATELQDRARQALERRDSEYQERYRTLGVSDELTSLEGLTPGMLVTLGENDIKTLDDFAGLAGDELLEMLAASDKGGVKLELDDANALIMAARAHWYEPAETGAAEKEESQRLPPRAQSQ